MSFVHNGVNLFTENTHSVIFKGEYDLPVEFGQYFGLVGESNIVGQTKGRDLFLEAHADNYVTPAALESDITALQNHTNTPLFGSLVFTYPSGSAVTFQFCRLDAVIESQEGIRFDPIVQKYYTDVAFRWRQLQ